MANYNKVGTVDNISLFKASDECSSEIAITSQADSQVWRNLTSKDFNMFSIVGDHYTILDLSVSDIVEKSL